MHRISSQLPNADTQFNLRRQEVSHNKSMNQIGTQQRIQELRDDPLAAGHLVRYQSFLSRIERFEKNANVLSDQYAVREGYMQQSVEVMQRVRELAVEGANGIYTKEDLKNMAGEVDELLKELVQNANATGPNGVSLFSGTRNKGNAFDAIMGTAPNSSEPVITGVRYNGNIDKTSIEIDENAYILQDAAGNRTFWAEPQSLFASRDATNYQVTKNSEISVDGQKIALNTGDNIFSIIAKINDSGASVKANLDPVTKGLNLVTTDARQLWLEDTNGTTLQDLGLIKDRTQRPPYNIASSTRVGGASMFDAIIALRDAMLTGDTETIGGRVLGSIDSGLNNMLAGLSRSGSATERLMLNAKRNGATALNITKLVSNEGDVDFTQAVTDLKMMEYVNQATLANSAKLYSSTLLNYMR